MNCEHARNLIHAYLDGELPAHEVAELESHLLDCADCREEHSVWKEVVDVVRGSAGAYSPSAVSAKRTEALISQVSTPPRRPNYQLLAAGIVLALLGGGLAAWITGTPTTTGGESFRQYAAESHLRYARGGLALDVESADPVELSRWLTENLPFHLEVPAYPSAMPEEKAYTLVGARLLRESDDDVAFLSYTMNNRPVSLLVSTTGGREPNGGQLYRSSDLEFHFHSVDGLELISWMDGGLSYVIVSDVDAAGAESCVVCHGQTDERPKFESLQPLI